jgi:transcriptional regulator GlxA family with amidase domain
MGDPQILDWIRTVHSTSTWTTSVCTGSLILAAAGVLRDLEATTHWNYLELLRAFGARPVRERTVQRGKVITAAGVSAGIDMALRLAQLIAGETVAKAIQLSIEYDPDPPFGDRREGDPAEHRVRPGPALRHRLTRQVTAGTRRPGATSRVACRVGVARAGESTLQSYFKVNLVKPPAPGRFFAQAGNGAKRGPKGDLP